MRAHYLMIFVLLVTLTYCGQFDGNDYYYQPAKQSNVKPVVVYHGIDDSCHGGLQTGIVDQLGEELSTYVRCVEYAANFKTWSENILKQTENACNLTKQYPQFQKGFSIVGISAGGVVARYVTQACEMEGTVENFVTLGGPHMGVDEIPLCHSGIICDIGNFFVDQIAYFDFVQKLLGPAGYYRDVRRYRAYLEHSLLLADLNNERETKNESYKQRITALKKMTLVMFTLDEVVYPRESEWFGTFASDGKTLLTLEETEFYKQNWLGLKTLEEAGKLTKGSIVGKHVHWHASDITRLVVPGLKDEQ